MKALIIQNTNGKVYGDVIYVSGEKVIVTKIEKVAIKIATDEYLTSITEEDFLTCNTTREEILKASEDVNGWNLAGKARWQARYNYIRKNNK